MGTLFSLNIPYRRCGLKGQSRSGRHARQPYDEFLGSDNLGGIAGMHNHCSLSRLNSSCAIIYDSTRFVNSRRAAFIIVFPLMMPVVAMMIRLPSVSFLWRVYAFSFSNEPKRRNLSVRATTQEEHYGRLGFCSIKELCK